MMLGSASMSSLIYQCLPFLITVSVSFNSIKPQSKSILLLKNKDFRVFLKKTFKNYVITFKKENLFKKEFKISSLSLNLIRLIKNSFLIRYCHKAVSTSITLLLILYLLSNKKPLMKQFSNMLKRAKHQKFQTSLLQNFLHKRLKLKFIKNQISSKMKKKRNLKAQKNNNRMRKAKKLFKSMIYLSKLFNQGSISCNQNRKQHKIKN